MGWRSVSPITPERCIPSLAAVALGATVVEAHIVFDRRMFGPDASSSLTVDEFAGLVKGVRFLEAALANPLDKGSPQGLGELKKIFGKSLSVVRDIRAGETLAFEDLESRKPAGQGIPAREFQRVVGARAARALRAGEFIQEADLHATMREGRYVSWWPVGRTTRASSTS